MSDNSINYILIAFVVVILGAALITPIAVNINSTTDTINVVNETYNLSTLTCVTMSEGWVNQGTLVCNLSLTNAPSGWKVGDCPLTDIVVHNNTGGQEFTIVTDYNIDPAVGIVQMINSSTTRNWANGTEVDYTYCADDYLNSGWGRSVLLTVPGFFALAILGAGIWLFIRVFKETDII